MSVSKTTSTRSMSASGVIYGFDVANSSQTAALVVTSNGSLISSGSSLATGQYAVTATAGQVVAARTGRMSVSLINPSSNAIYVGAAGVTTTTGYAIPANTTIKLDVQSALYAVAATTGSTVSFIEVF